MIQRTMRRATGVRGGLTRAGGLGVLLLAVAAAPSGCENVEEPAPLTYGVDPSIRPSQDALPGLDRGAPRPVGVVIGPSGRRTEFITNEIVFHPSSPQELDAFIAKYGATVLRDGTPSAVAGLPAPPPPLASSGWYLLRVDPGRSTPADLPVSAMGLGPGGHYRFSSTDAVRLAAIVARERERGVGLNVLTYDQTVTERAEPRRGGVDASRSWWMTADDDPVTPGAQGLSSSVALAWDYLEYQGVLPPREGFRPARVAILDGRHPGSAGTGGDAVQSIPIAIGGDLYTLADAIHAAAVGGADIIDVRASGGCGDLRWLCSAPPDDIYDLIQHAVDAARSRDATVVAGAGNEGIDIGEEDVIPCEARGVLCVGSVDRNRRNVYNHGSPVDVWAPTGIRSTTGILRGTGASTSFVAGVVGLMKVLDPSMTPARVLDLLQQTANPSPDPVVGHGYVNAYRAVRAAKPDRPPAVHIEKPGDGERILSTHVSIEADVTDPEVARADLDRWRPTVLFASDREGLLCTVTHPPFTCAPGWLTAGTHVITVIATDAFGAVGADRITLRVVEHSRYPKIRESVDDGI